MEVIRHINSFHSSNTYILINGTCQDIWLVDPGDGLFLIDVLQKEGFRIKGILLSHSHVDHIYGLNDLCRRFGPLNIYASLACVEGLHNAKLNLSAYLGFDIVLEWPCCMHIVGNMDIIQLWDGIEMEIHFTPGHNNESLCFSVENMLFTGDTFLPGVRTFTKFQGGNKEKAIESIKFIQKRFPANTIIYPGHGNSEILEQAKIIF